MREDEEEERQKKRRGIEDKDEVFSGQVLYIHTYIYILVQDFVFLCFIHK